MTRVAERIRICHANRSRSRLISLVEKQDLCIGVPMLPTITVYKKEGDQKCGISVANMRLVTIEINLITIYLIRIKMK